ncbi:hypothetical protein A2U01_0092495, partial [Trifolium medium]|nr:hypothetical protein [Trifolium medium]
GLILAFEIPQMMELTFQLLTSVLQGFVVLSLMPLVFSEASQLVEQFSPISGEVLE